LFSPLDREDSSPRIRKEPHVTARRTMLFSSVLVAFVAALVIAGCGNSSSSYTATAKTSASSGAGATVEVRNAGLGRILVDSQGRTLYLFEKDKGPKSTCFGACASVWPPFRTSGRPTGTGVKSSLLGMTSRSDGKPEVTYNGHPLYYYAGDQQAGETNGQGLTQFGGGWYVVSPAGNAIDNG
jgi:predicted lipoprotein with Yx(FWY)xxD motif